MQTCIWCGDYLFSVETKVCKPCLTKAVKQCTRCKRPYTSLKYFRDENAIVCNSCTVVSSNSKIYKKRKEKMIKQIKKKLLKKEKSLLDKMKLSKIQPVKPPSRKRSKPTSRPSTSTSRT